MFVYNEETKKREPLIGGEWDPLDVSSLGERSYGSDGSINDSSDDDDNSDDSSDSEEQESSSSEEEETESPATSDVNEDVTEDDISW